MEFKTEKDEVVERYVRSSNYLVVSEDELRQLYDVNEQNNAIMFNGNYEAFRDEVVEGQVHAWIEFHGYRIQFVLKEVEK